MVEVSESEVPESDGGGAGKRWLRCRKAMVGCGWIPLCTNSFETKFSFEQSDTNIHAILAFFFLFYGYLSVREK